MHIQEKLTQLRKKLQEKQCAAFLLPVSDEYLNEYLPPATRRLEWFTGFTGSAGQVVVTQQKAALFTDGRYTLQAAQEVETAYFSLYNSGEISPASWLAEHVESGSSIGYDPAIMSARQVEHLAAGLAEKEMLLKALHPNPIDMLWEDRPPWPAEPVWVLDHAFAGVTIASKLQQVSNVLKEKHVDVLIVAQPDAVNWLLNMRGGDLEFTPMVLASALVDATQEKIHLFMDTAKLSGEARTLWNGLVDIYPTDGLLTEVKRYAHADNVIGYDPATTPANIVATARAEGKAVAIQNPVELLKACKNATELKGIRDCHIRDGVALTKLLCWLDQHATKGEVTELDVCKELLRLRAKGEHFISLSFPTIAGSGPHGAIVHYRVDAVSNRTLQPDELFLLDSGGQYKDGTTDVTRTVAIGTPQEEHKTSFTHVLKGHIALALAQFPKGVSGSALDSLARIPLWQQGMDYDHGTGHGVGHALNVHEGPQRISKRGGDVALHPGMILSNEPGYYKSGAFGIRIENLVEVVEKTQGDDGRIYYGFNTLTCAPIDTRLVETTLLNDAEKTWLNTYHAWVKSELNAMLTKDEQVWLTQACAPLT